MNEPNVTINSWEMAPVLPFYILCDEGSSMAGESIQAVNDGIGALFKAVSSDPIVDARARVSIVVFSDSADVILPLSQISSVSSGMPGCLARGLSSYSAAFRKMKEQIDSDVAALKAQNLRVLRPVVFFISDGTPSDESWLSEHASLTDSAYKYRPHIMSFGVAGAQADVILEVATPVNHAGSKKYAWKAHDGSSGLALTELFRHLLIRLVGVIGFTDPDLNHSTQISLP